MPFNNLRQSFRSLSKHKIFTAINIFGLSIGISAALVIYLIVQYDYSYDRYEPNRGRIYRLVTHGENWDNAGLPVPAQRALGSVTGIEVKASFLGMNDNGTKVAVTGPNGKERRIFKKQDKFVYADSSYFLIFPHQWLAGNPGLSLRDPFQVVLCESLAHRYFPGLPPDQVMGKSIAVDDSILMVVSGVVRDLDAQTDFDHQAFLSTATIAASRGLKDLYQWDEWGSTTSANQLMLLVSPNASTTSIEQQITAIFNKHTDPNWRSRPSLQPLADVHFNMRLEGKVEKSTMLNLSLLAVFILLLGSINFINLATAQASQRSKEVGMRRLLGSSKGQLIGRYLSETVILTAIAAFFSLLITPLVIKGFADFLPQGLVVGRIWQPHVLLFLVFLIAIVGILSGLYPAFVLTHIPPLSATRNETLSVSGGNRRIWLRKTLTVSQFVIAQVFIIGVFIVNAQIRYALRLDMGFRTNAIVNFYVPFDFAHPDGRKFVLENKLRTIPGVQEVCLGNGAPALGGYMTTIVIYNDGKKDLRMPADIRRGETGYIRLYGIRLLAGHNVLASDSVPQFLVNQALAADLGFRRPEDAIGHMLKNDPAGKGIPIVGVMADFHLASVDSAIHPMVFSYDSKYGYVMSIALAPSAGNWSKAIAKMKRAWAEVYPEQDFDYSFLDNTIAGFYDRDERVSKLLTWAAGVAVLISCLGLLGLVIFTANQRTKEIGIRKVLGASMTQIIGLLSKDFIWLVALAFAIAVPVAWYGANKWMQSFAYHTTLKWWLFAVAGLAMLAIALLILSVRAARAALANPVKSLRSD